MENNKFTLSSPTYGLSVAPRKLIQHTIESLEKSKIMYMDDIFTINISESVNNKIKRDQVKIENNKN